MHLTQLYPANLIRLGICIYLFILMYINHKNNSKVTESSVLMSSMYTYAVETALLLKQKHINFYTILPLHYFTLFTDKV